MAGKIAVGEPTHFCKTTNERLLGYLKEAVVDSLIPLPLDYPNYPWQTPHKSSYIEGYEANALKAFSPMMSSGEAKDAASALLIDAFSDKLGDTPTELTRAQRVEGNPALTKFYDTVDSLVASHPRTLIAEDVPLSPVEVDVMTKLFDKVPDECRTEARAYALKSQTELMGKLFGKVE